MSTSTMGKHRARITLASLMSRLTGIEDARGIPMPAGVTNIEQLRDLVEGVEVERVPQHVPTHRADRDKASATRLLLDHDAGRLEVPIPAGWSE